MTDEHEVELRTEIRDLVAKAKALVDMLDEREKYHGSLIGLETLFLVNDLRLELARWK